MAGYTAGFLQTQVSKYRPAFIASIIMLNCLLQLSSFVVKVLLAKLADTPYFGKLYVFPA